MQKQVETRIGLNEWDMIGKAMYPKSSTLIVHIFAVICLFMIVRSYTNGSSAMAVYYLLLGIVLEGFTQLAKHNRLKANRNFFMQQYGDKELVLIYDFKDDGFEVVNQLSGDKTESGYDVLASYKTVGDYLLLKAKNRQYFIIGKAAAEEAELIAFLETKVPELKDEDAKR